MFLEFVVRFLLHSFLSPSLFVCFFLFRPFYLAVVMRSHVVFGVYEGERVLYFFLMLLRGNPPPPSPPLALPLRLCACDVTLAKGRPGRGIWLRRLRVSLPWVYGRRRAGKGGRIADWDCSVCCGRSGDGLASACESLPSPSVTYDCLACVLPRCVSPCGRPQVGGSFGL